MVLKVRTVLGVLKVLKVRTVLEALGVLSMWCVAAIAIHVPVQHLSTAPQHLEHR